MNNGNKVEPEDSLTFCHYVGSQDSLPHIEELPASLVSESSESVSVTLGTVDTSFKVIIIDDSYAPSSSSSEAHSPTLVDINELDKLEYMLSP